MRETQTMANLLKEGLVDTQRLYSVIISKAVEDLSGGKICLISDHFHQHLQEQFIVFHFTYLKPEPLVSQVCFAVSEVVLPLSKSGSTQTS